MDKLALQLPKTHFKPDKALDYYKSATINVPGTSTADIFKLTHKLDNVVYVIPAILVEPFSAMIYRFYKNGALIGFLKNDIAAAYLYERQKFADYMREYPWYFKKGDTLLITGENTGGTPLTATVHVMGFTYIEQEMDSGRGENHEDNK